MLAEMDSNTEIIYIELLDEGTKVFRPTFGVPLGGSRYRVLETSDYDADDEVWKFVPGSVVRCIRKKEDGEEILIATELVEMS